MQGQRSAIGSLPDSINFGDGSTSSNMGIDQQICWNSLHDPAESRLSEYRVAPGSTDPSLGAVNPEARNLSRWNTGEPSSSNLQNLISHDERMAQGGWSSSMNASAGAAPRLEDRVYDSTSVISRNGVNLNLNSNQMVSGTSFMLSSNHVSTSEIHDSNVGQLSQDGGDLMECSNSSKSGELEHRLIASSSGSSEPCTSSPGSGGFMVEEDDGRPGCSLDGRRLSCKRKMIEGNVGQSSSSASCCSREGSMWQAVPPRYDAGSSSLSVPPQLQTSLGAGTPDLLNPRLRLSMGGVAPHSAPSVGFGAENFQRNYRLRTNPTSQQDSLPNNTVLPRVSGHSDVPAGHQPLRFIPVNSPLDLIPPIHPGTVAPQEQSAVLRFPGLRRNTQSVRWNGASSSRAGSSTTSPMSEERDASLPEDLNSRPIPRNISEHPMFIPSVEVRSNSAHNPTDWSFSGGGLGTSTSRHVGSSSRAGHVSSSQSSSGPNWGARHHTSSQYSRRLAEYVRRSLESAVEPESGLQSGSTSAHRSASSSQEMVLPSAGGSRVQSPPSSRSALRMDRHGDGVTGFPYSLRTLAAGSEGRSRLVSEHIRSVLDIMRRGEGLRFEDVMVLDPSVFFGMADIHDQHREMRLDVDNMSYEELLALEERIGNVCTGLSEETVMARMKQRKYASDVREDQADTEPCCVCQEEYNDGEDLGTLDCGHDFHTECIKQWLAQKNLCPICKTTGLAT